MSCKARWCNMKKQRHHFADKGPCSQSCGFSSSHVWIWELDYKESWALKNWSFWTVVLEKTLESPLDCKEIQPVHPKGNQFWIFTGRTDAEAGTPILWRSAFFTVQLSHPYMTTGKTIALTRWIFVDKVMSLLFNMLSRSVFWKDPDAGKGWGWEEKGMTEDEMVEWYHWLNGHEFG